MWRHETRPRDLRSLALVSRLLALVAGSRVRRRHAFIGANTLAGQPPAKGFAVGAGLLVLGFEFEYSDTTDDLAAGAPSLKTGMGNVLLQTPVAFAGFQPYFTVGGGVYHEELGDGRATPGSSATPAAA